VLMNDSSSLSKLTAIAAAFEDNAARGERCFAEILKLNKSPATLRSFAAFLEVGGQASAWRCCAFECVWVGGGGGGQVTPTPHHRMWVTWLS
jgi:hypothetical protein